MAQEIHVLLPHCWEFDAAREPALDSSGFDLYFTTQPPRYEAAVVGFLDEKMAIEPGQGIVDHTSTLAPHVAQEALGTNASILAIHLHTHDMFERKWFEIIGANETQRFVSPVEGTGYARGVQSMRGLSDSSYPGWPSPRLDLRAGDKLAQHCSVDTNKLDQTLRYGIRGQEMCACLMVVGGPSIASTRPHALLAWE